MRLEKLELENFRAIESAELELHGKSTVIFGNNGTGKSSVLRSINLLYANIINQIVNRKELKQSYAIKLEDIKYGRKETQITALIDFDGNQKSYYKKMVRNTGKSSYDAVSLKEIAEIFHEKYISLATQALSRWRRAGRMTISD